MSSSWTGLSSSPWLTTPAPPHSSPTPSWPAWAAIRHRATSCPDPSPPPSSTTGSATGLLSISPPISPSRCPPPPSADYAHASVAAQFRNVRTTRSGRILSTVHSPASGTAYGHARRPFRPGTKMVFVVPQRDPPADRQAISTSCGREFAAHLGSDGLLEKRMMFFLAPRRFGPGSRRLGRASPAFHWRSSAGRVYSAQKASRAL